MSASILERRHRLLSVAVIIGQPSAPSRRAAVTITTMQPLIASGSVGQASMMACRPGSSCAFFVSTAPASAPVPSGAPRFPGVFRGMLSDCKSGIPGSNPGGASLESRNDFFQLVAAFFLVWWDPADPRGEARLFEKVGFPSQPPLERSFRPAPALRGVDGTSRVLDTRIRDFRIAGRRMLKGRACRGIVVTCSGLAP